MLKRAFFCYNNQQIGYIVSIFCYKLQLASGVTLGSWRSLAMSSRGRAEAGVQSN